MGASFSLDQLLPTLSRFGPYRAGYRAPVTLPELTATAPAPSDIEVALAMPRLGLEDRTQAANRVRDINARSMANAPRALAAGALKNWTTLPGLAADLLALGTRNPLFVGADLARGANPLPLTQRSSEATDQFVGNDPSAPYAGGLELTGSLAGALLDLPLMAGASAARELGTAGTAMRSGLSRSPLLDRVATRLAPGFDRAERIRLGLEAAKAADPGPAHSLMDLEEMITGTAQPLKAPDEMSPVERELNDALAYAQNTLSVAKRSGLHPGEQLEVAMDRLQKARTAFDRAPNADMQRVVDDYVAGMPQRPTALPEITAVDEDRARAMARVYEGLESRPDDPAVQSAYRAFVAETQKQYEALQRAGYRFEFVDEDPYKNSAEMMRDLRDNKRLKVFKSKEGDHPLLSPEENDIFRAVHDAIGHGAGGYQFGAKGEELAFRKHAAMYSPEARRVMATETRGQNSWVNFGPNGHLPVSQRPFAQQKAALWPEAYLGDYADMPSPSRSSTKPVIKAATIQLGDGRVFEGRTHAGAVLAAEDAGITPELIDDAISGFRVNDGRVVSREEAARIAGFENGELDASFLPNLFSETGRVGSKPVQRYRITHFSPREDLSVLDPKFSGTGPVTGAERKRGAKGVHVFLENTPGRYEDRFGKSSMARYEGSVDAALYDVSKDPEGIVARTLGRGKGDAAFQTALRKAGYHGYTNPEYTSGGKFKQVAVLLDKTPVKRAGARTSTLQRVQKALGIDNQRGSVRSGLGEGADPIFSMKKEDGSETVRVPLPKEMGGGYLSGTIPAPEARLPDGLDPERFLGPTSSNPRGGEYRVGKLRDPSKPATPDNIMRVPMRRFSYESHSKLYDIEVDPAGERVYLVNGKPGEPTRYHRAIEQRYGLPESGPVPPELRSQEQPEGHLRLMDRVQKALGIDNERGSIPFSRRPTQIPDSGPVDVEVFHGTGPREFDKFKAGEGPSNLGPGAVFFTNDPKAASHYAKGYEGGRVVRARVQLRNPLRVGEEGLPDGATVESLRAQGYDGVIFPSEYAEGREDVTVAVFDPENASILGGKAPAEPPRVEVSSRALEIAGFDDEARLYQLGIEAEPGPRGRMILSGDPNKLKLVLDDMETRLREYDGLGSGMNSGRSDSVLRKAVEALKKVLGSEQGSIEFSPTGRKLFGPYADAPSTLGTSAPDPRLAPSNPKVKGPSELIAGMLDNRIVKKGLLEDIEAGLRVPGTAQWYETGPLGALFEDLGMAVTPGQFINRTGSASMQNPVFNELASASALDRAMREGLSATEAAEVIQRENPGYSKPWVSKGMLTNAQRAEAEGVQLPEDAGSPSRKIPFYTRGKLGGSLEDDVALDTHERRRALQLAWQSPTLRKLMKQLGLSPETDVLPIANATDYSAYSGLYRDIAKRLGLPSAQQAQAGRWVGGATKTGLKSHPSGTWLDELAKSVERTAEAKGLPTDGESLRKLFKDIVEGRVAARPKYDKAN